MVCTVRLLPLVLLCSSDPWCVKNECDPEMLAAALCAARFVTVKTVLLLRPYSLLHR